MKICVIGGAGFIGSYTCRLLEQKGINVFAIDNLSTGRIENISAGTVFYNLDILNYERIFEVFSNERPDVIIHLAAQTQVSYSIENPVEDLTTNVVGSLNILEAMRQTGVKRIVYASSAAVYGEPVYLPIDESHPLNMKAGYGVSKHTVEHYLEIYKNLYNIQYCALRYANVYGYGQSENGESGVISIFIRQLMWNQPVLIYGDGHQTRDFICVEDVANANYITAVTDISGIFNVGTGIQSSVLEVFENVRTTLRLNIRPMFQPPRKGDIKDSFLATSKINRMTDWRVECSLNANIKKMVHQIERE